MCFRKPVCALCLQDKYSTGGGKLQYPKTGIVAPKPGKRVQKMGNTTVSFLQQVLEQLHERQRELGYSNETLMQLTKISKTTFYNIWRDRDVTHMDMYHIERLCEALKIELSANIQDSPAEKIEISEEVKAEVAANTADLLTTRKEVIEQQGEKIEDLSAQLTEKQQIEDEHLRQILEMHSEIRVLHENYSRRIEELQRELSRRCDQICELAMKVAEK
jgi:hypothetical protein